MNIEFNLSQAPKDPEVEVYHPDGTLLVRTDDEKMFLYICKTIKEQKAEGYYVVMADDMDKYRKAIENGEKTKEPYHMEIANYGRIKDFRLRPHSCTNFFRSYAELLRAII